MFEIITQTTSSRHPSGSLDFGGFFVECPKHRMYKMNTTKREDYPTVKLSGGEQMWEHMMTVRQQDLRVDDCQAAES